MITGVGALPWAEVVFPTAAEGPAWLGSEQALGIPGVARAVGLIAGLMLQMPLEDYEGPVKQPRPRLLEAPDPDRSRAWFVGQQVTDWLLHGNAVCRVTARDGISGWPVAVSHVPAARVSVTQPEAGERVYWLDGQPVPSGEIVHVQRGQDPMNLWRGIGVVEQHLATLQRVREQERAERESLQAGVPSVVVVAPNPDLSQEEAEAAKTRWVETYAGPGRKPAVLPKGTEVTPLAWSPHDAQMVQARELSLKDVANIFNLDGYWLGASAGSFTYRSPGPLYLHLLRQTLGPVLEHFEGGWTPAFVPPGRAVKFDTQAILGDDLGTTISWLSEAVTNQILTPNEAREYLGKPPIAGLDTWPAVNEI